MKQQVKAGVPARRTYNCDEVAALLGISKGSAYAAVRSGQIPGLRIGGRVVVPAAVIERLLESADSKPAA